MPRINELPSKGSIADNDVLLIEDAANNNVNRKVTGATLRAASPVQSVAGKTGVVTVTKGDVGLENVENTALSTWAGSSNITTIGTLVAGIVPVARISGLAASATTDTTNATNISSGTLAAARLPSVNLGTTSVDLTRASGALSLTGVSIDGSAGSVAWSGISSKPTTISGFGITDAPTLTGNNTLSGANTITIAAGSAAAPSLYPTGDSNTGIYSPGADQLAVSTGGTQRLTVDASGNVGIGTASPALIGGSHKQLFVTGGSTTQGGFFFAANSDNSRICQMGITGAEAWFGTRDTTPLIFTINNSERLRIDSSGNLGIGTTSPTNLLDVNADSIRVRSSRTPASATASGNAGEICWDSSYVYVCVAANTWRRAALSSW